MKIAVIGANGKAGSLIVKEAVDRGFDVTAFVRRPNSSAAQHSVEKDIFDITKADLAGFDAVVNAFGTWGADQSLHTKVLMHLADAVSGTNTRLLVVGGAGSLYLDDTKTLQVKDAPDFPDEYKPTANAMAESLAELRKRDDVRWTYVSPAADFNPEGHKTGEYTLAGEVFTVNQCGVSAISYADYALAMVDEIDKGNHIKEIGRAHV